MPCQEKIAQGGRTLAQDERKKRVQFATQVFNDYSDDIRAIIRYSIRDESLVDDIYQDFFLSLITTKMPEHIKNMRSFLYTAITNDIVSMSRRIRRRRDRLKVYAQEESRVAREMDGPGARLIRNEEKEQALLHLQKHLCPSEFKAIISRFRAGGDNEQAAKHLGIKKRSFIRYLCSALKKIRKIQLNEEGLPG